MCKLVIRITTQTDEKTISNTHILRLKLPTCRRLNTLDIHKLDRGIEISAADRKCGWGRGVHLTSGYPDYIATSALNSMLLISRCPIN